MIKDTRSAAVTPLLRPSLVDFDDDSEDTAQNIMDNWEFEFDPAAAMDGLPMNHDIYIQNNNTNPSLQTRGRFSHLDASMHAELFADIQDLCNLFPFDKLDPLMAPLLQGYTNAYSSSPINYSMASSFLVSIIETIAYYETYFCAVDLVFDGAFLDIGTWRHMVSLLHLRPPHSFDSLFKEEIWRGMEITPKTGLSSCTSEVYLILKKLCGLVNKFRHGRAFSQQSKCYCTQSISRQSLHLYTTSLVHISKRTPYLQSLLLPNTTLHPDTFFKETGEYASMICHDIPDYYTRKVISPHDALVSIFFNCEGLVYLDLSSNSWVTRETVELIIRCSKALHCLNLMFCAQLAPLSLAKLWVFEDGEGLREGLEEVLKGKDRGP